MTMISQAQGLTLLLTALLFWQIPALASEQESRDKYYEMPDRPNGDKPEALPISLKLPFFKSGNKEDEIAHGSITIMGSAVPPATSMRLSWKPQDTFESIAAPTPVLVLNGATPGPTLCLTGAVHGDEINGIEIIRQVFFDLDPLQLSGVLVGIPIVNQMGFRRGSRYLPDRRDLNRYFPGDPTGSSASRIAHGFFHDVVTNCDALVDLHTGSFHRTNIPQLRADMDSEQVSQLVHGFGDMIVLHSKGASGTLRRAAVEAGIPAVTVEAGEPMHIQEAVVQDGVRRIRNLMANLGMYRGVNIWSEDEPVYLNSRWVRSEEGGLLISKVKLGAAVEPGDLLGNVVNPINNDIYPIKSPHKGRVIGMALNQVVMPGYAAYHVGIEATEDTLEPAEQKPDDTEAQEQASIEEKAPVESEESDLPELDE